MWPRASGCAAAVEFVWDGACLGSSFLASDLAGWVLLAVEFVFVSVDCTFGSGLATAWVEFDCDRPGLLDSLLVACFSTVAGAEGAVALLDEFAVTV